MSFIPNAVLGALPPSEARHWTFGDWEFDELAHQLLLRGQPVELESKPLEVLLQLLLHSGEVLTRNELLDSVWPGTSVVEGSLTTAISKLRRTLGEENAYILTVPRVGYRLAVPVQVRLSSAVIRADFGFAAGTPVPRREQWRFLTCLDSSPATQVWLAENPRTRESRVFKFASDALHLSALKREVTVSRFLRDSLGERPWLIRTLEWNFEAAPWFIESEYAGDNLADWAASRGGLTAISLPTRLAILTAIAEAVAEAHTVGVLHKDLKPTNILVSGSASTPQIRIADFGSSSLTDPSRLAELGITNLGFPPDSDAAHDPLTGTLMYLAPEVLSGHVPTISSDVYALGVILYQLLAADFRKPLAPGWETGISDPLLLRDIAEAASGDTALRLKSAAELANRLRTLDNRRIRHDELAAAERRARLAERKLALSGARRPWIAAASIALAAGAAASLFLYVRADSDRNQARHQTAIAQSVNAFLSDDLLGRTDPFRAGNAEESFTAVVSLAAEGIDRRFSSDPAVAARLHQTIARALDQRTDYAAARREYDRAATLFADPEARAVVYLQRAAMEARSYEKGALPRAKAILARQEKWIPQLRNPGPELQVWLSSARGMVALIDNDAKAAAAGFQAAVDAAGPLPSFDETARLTLRQRLAFAYIRTGDGERAEREARNLIAAFTRLAGADSPHVLRVRLTLAQALMIQGRHEAVIAETNAIYPAFVSRLGPAHELSMQLLTTRAQSEGSLQLWGDAIRDDLQIHEIAVHKQGPLSFFAVATLSDAALAQCRGGQLNAGLTNARASYEDAKKAFGPRAGLTGGTAYALAACMIEAGQPAQAEPLLTSIDIPAVAQLAGVSDWGANVDLARAQIAMEQGNLTLAKELAGKATPAFTHAGAEPYQKQALDTLKVELSR